MSAGDCAAFVRQIETRFAYLISDHGFEVADTLERMSGEHCCVLLKSSRCLLKFLANAGSVEIGVATVSAPAGWADTSNGVRYWFSLQGVLRYLQNRTLSAEESQQLGERLWKMSADEYLEYMASEVYPLREELMGLFEEEAFASRRAEVESFLRA